MYKSISFTDPNFATKLIDEFKSEGVVVIDNVIGDLECDMYMDQIVDSFCKLGSGIVKDDIVNTWKDENLPAQIRPGLFQCLMSNLQPLYNIRSNENIRSIFQILYSHLRNTQINDFIVSGDGINIKPGMVGPFMTNKTRDWAHVDQTDISDIYKCIQGQMVLTNTTASFVATPKSHLSYIKIMEELKIALPNKSNWLKFTDKQIVQVKNIINKSPVNAWQIPILSKKGSLIIWSSTTIHSARLQNKAIEPKIDDKFYGWRGVVYVCYRPKDEFNKEEIQNRVQAFENNRGTNHWGTKIFEKRPQLRFYVKKNDIIEEMLDDPLIVYNKVGKPILNDVQKQLIGL